MQIHLHIKVPMGTYVILLFSELIGRSVIGNMFCGTQSIYLPI
jgi:hypothetical protein